VLGARSETGYVRAANEDRMGFIRTAHGDVYVVSDGMGGYRGGALAAELTVQTLRDRLSALAPASGAFTDQVRDAFLVANQAVFQRRRSDDPDTRDMGATGVALITHGARALVGHVGDSRAYLASRGTLRQLTRDHTRVQKMVDAGLLTPAQAAVHPDASMLDRAIGHAATVEVDVSDWITLKPGDMVLLCSDGLCGYVSDAEIGQVLRRKGSPQQLADSLVDCALGKGGEDNVTVQLLRYGRDPARPWLAVWARPTVVVPLSVLATGAVAWGLALPSIEAAKGRSAALQSELTTARQQLAVLTRQKGDMDKQVATLETRLAATVAAAASASDERGAKPPVPVAVGPAAAPKPATPPAKTSTKPTAKPPAKPPTKPPAKPPIKPPLTPPPGPSTNASKERPAPAPASASATAPSPAPATAPPAAPAPAPPPATSPAPAPATDTPPRDPPTNGAPESATASPGGPAADPSPPGGTTHGEPSHD